MKSKTIANFTSGLMLGPPPDLIAEGGVVRNRGIHPLASGAFRSRCSQDGIHDLDAHSIAYFANRYHLGVGTSLYRGLTEVITGLSGDRLAFARMAPVAGLADQLFIAGGGTLYKVDSAGDESLWGISPPTALSAALAAGGALTDGSVYQYKITYANSTTGHRSNGNATAASATPSGANLSVTLTFAASTDPQVDTVEVWRTGPNGTAFFLLDTTTDIAGTYTDDGSETLSTTELPTDNLKPSDYFDDCIGPHNASMFWITRSESPYRGRVYYSPIGRAESVEGYIEVSSDDAPLQKLFLLQGQLGVIGEAGIYLIGGTNPYIDRAVPGCPGTTKPHTVAVTPAGLLYEAHDGPYLFDGTTAAPVAPGAVDVLFRGLAAGSLDAFSGLVSAYGRGEFILSDGDQTIAYDPLRQRWRDLGLGCSALMFNEETGEFAATVSEQVVNLEAEGIYADVPIDLEPPTLRLSSDAFTIIENVVIEYDTGGEQLSVELTLDGTVIDAGVIQSAARVVETINISRAAKRIRIRIHGTVSAEVFIYRITFEISEPGGRTSAATKLFEALEKIN